MKKSTTRTTIIIVFLIIAVVGYYAYLSNKRRVSQTESSMSVVQSTLSRDLNNNYPPTPREVVKYYNEILKCLYNEESTEEEIDALGLKARELYDADLLAINELGVYQIRLRSDVESFREKNQRISGINLAGTVNVDTFERDGFSFAKIRCDYVVMQAGKNNSADQMYLLRKDENKRWKIYGWKSVDSLEEQSE